MKAKEATEDCVSSEGSDLFRPGELGGGGGGKRKGEGGNSSREKRAGGGAIAKGEKDCVLDSCRFAY